MQLLVDVMCGGVISYLRMCNHDTAYAGDRGLEADDAVLAAARDENRTVVTRDERLAARADGAVLLESRDTEVQLAELVDAGLDLSLADEPAFCGRCNGSLERVDSTTVTPEYAPDAVDVVVWICCDCGQHFWRGSHWDRVGATLSRVSDSTDE